MSLVEANLAGIIKRQYIFKLKALTGMILSLLVVQVIALLLSFTNTGMSGSGTNTMQVSIYYYSGEIPIVFTLIWVFIAAIVLTSKKYRDMDFTFVSNRISSHISNIAFLGTVCMASGITASLGGIMTRIIMYFTVENVGYYTQGFYITPTELLIGIAATVLYAILVGAMGYLVGILVQLSRAFIIVLPALFYALIIYKSTDYTSTEPVLVTITKFFTGESNFLLFCIKIFTTVFILFAFSIWISNRLEVRK